MPTKLTPEEWKNDGGLYVANTPVLRISKQFGVARISIDLAAKRFGWVKIPREDIEEVVQIKVLTLDYETVTKDTRERISLAGKLLAVFEADAGALSTAQRGEMRSHGTEYKAQAESRQVDEVDARERKALVASLVQLSQTYHERTTAKEEESA